jgi:Uma2 family endonuclease
MRETSWIWEAYLDWEARQPIRYELVDGQVHGMGGGTAEHDIIGNNLRAALHTQLRGKPCRPHGPDLKVRAGRDGRYLDALIDCGPRVPDAIFAQEPVAVFEVLSKSTGWIDQSLKLHDYDATPTIRTYVLISQDVPRAMVYTRDADGRLGIESAVFSRAGGRLSRSRCWAWRCRFLPFMRAWNSPPTGRMPLILTDRSKVLLPMGSRNV